MSGATLSNNSPVRAGLNDTKRRFQPQGFLQSGFGRFFQSKLNWLMLGLFGSIIVISLVSPLICSTILNVKNPARPLDGTRSPYFAPPGTIEKNIVHWLGTDELGRDMLARLLTAGSTSLLIAFLVTALSLIIGLPLGLLAGFYGGWIDDVISFGVQIFLNVPSIFILVIVLGTFRPNVWLLSVLLALFNWMSTSRQVRGLVFSLRNLEYINAARSLGASSSRIMWVHIIPNLGSLVLVIIGFDIVGAILTESGLSYIGIGVQEPEVSWGKLLTRSSDYLVSAENRNPFLIIGPGLMIFLTTLCVFLLSDSLRDAFDPTLVN